MKSWFYIFELVCDSRGTPPGARKFWIAEIYMTSDGPRTRLLGGNFDTLEKAQAEVTRREEIMK